MAKFDYDDTVRIKDSCAAMVRRGEVASVIAILEDRKLWPLSQFRSGVIYSVEFADGAAIDVHEDELEATDESFP
jgi:hypothetical protein